MFLTNPNTNKHSLSTNKQSLSKKKNDSKKFREKTNIFSNWSEQKS